MKRSFLLITTIYLTSIATFSFGQQTSYLQSFSLMPSMYNPAAQGVDGGGVGLSYRNQFMDLPKEARPRILALNADISPILKYDRIGVGFLLMSDKASVINRNQATGYFGYHLFPSESRFGLSLGAMAGVLNQQFDFENKKISDPNDLVLLSGNLSKTVFDGGLGILTNYQAEGGSELYLHAVLPQLFTSDISFNNSANNESATFDLLPHLLTVAGFRFRRQAFAIEPNFCFRYIISDKKQKAANLDVNLILRFLENDRLMAGAGWRSDKGGLHVMLGAKILENLSIIGSFNSHQSLGASFETGIHYTFGKGGCGKNLTPEEGTISAKRIIVENAYNNAFGIATNTWDKISIANASIKEAEASNNFDIKNAKLQKAAQYLQSAQDALKKITTEVRKSELALMESEKAYSGSTASRKKPCNTEEIDEARQRHNETKSIESNLTSKLSVANMAFDKAKPIVNMGLWIKEKDSEKITNYLNQSFSEEKNLPDGLTASAFENNGGKLMLLYEFPDETEEYFLGNAKLSNTKAVLDHFLRLIGKLTSDEVNITALRLEIDVQYSQQGAKFSIGKSYEGEYGNKFKINYNFNGLPQVSQVFEPNKTLSFWDLAIFKNYSLSDYLLKNSNLDSNILQTNITAPNPGIESSFRIKFIVQVE